MRIRCRRALRRAEERMMDVKELWAQACELLKQEMNTVSYRTWIGDNLTAEKLDGNTLLLRVALENMKTMVNQKYAPMIAASVSQAAGMPVEVALLTKSELDQLQAANDAVMQSGDSQCPLNPKYTFDNFVVGGGNRFAYAAALAVAESPADAYNPLFIYGGVGLGKTHLMHAVGHYIRQQYPEKQILYIPGETFTHELIDAIQNKRTIEFRARFRNVDVLMVDDIQFIAGKESTQEEFFHTFNTLYNAHKQIILTSDRPPQEIARLEERLRSRFAWGLQADVKRPDIETRIAILREKAQQEHIAVGDDVLEIIATHVANNIRELEGCLIRLKAYADLVHRPITVELCNEALADLFVTPAKREVTAQAVMQVVAEYYAITVDDLIRPTRRREFAVPRQYAMYLTRDLTNMSLPQIGQAFGGRDHSTVLHACNIIAENIKKDAGVANVVNDLRSLIVEGK